MPVVILGVLTALAWSYWTPILGLLRYWKSDTDYSHSYFIVPAALYLLWRRRSQRPETSEASMSGLLVVLAGLALRGSGLIFQMVFLENVSLLVVLAGLVYWLLGRNYLQWSLPAIVLLAFMLPMPFKVASLGAAPLQRIGAIGGTFLLQTVGVPCMAEGTVINLENTHLFVEYACSGLQMMMAFLAVTYLLAYFSNYSEFGKLVLFLSAIPIAMVCNILRIATIGFGIHLMQADKAPPILHDASGVAFVPVAIVMVFAGMYLFERSFPKAPVSLSYYHYYHRPYPAKPAPPLPGQE